jgi:hypothetical protein
MAVQLEGIFNMDTEPISNYKTFSIIPALLLKYSHRSTIVTIAPFAGAYIDPFNEYKNTTVPFGWTAGLSLGYKVGPGNLFMDIRYAHDLFDNIVPLKNYPDTLISGYRKKMFTISVGYEYGFIPKQ